MIDSLATFSREVTRVAREVGLEGKLGVLAQVEGVEGEWKEITTNVNAMATNLTSQVRAFAQISTAATDGDFTRFVTVEASGEMDALKTKINQVSPKTFALCDTTLIGPVCRWSTTFEIVLRRILRPVKLLNWLTGQSQNSWRICERNR